MNTDALRALWKEAFGDGEAFLDDFFRTAYSPDRCLTLQREGRLAAMVYWFDCSLEGRKLAYVYGVAVAAEFRGRGLCRALMEELHANLEDQGYGGSLLVPGGPGLFRLYEKLGYEACAGIREFSCTAGDEAAALREVEPAEYARLRRELLPGGGVFQEGESLAFLNTQAELYAGENFLLAARKAGNRLRAVELLGDASRAPAILRCLDCEAGTFRTPGNDRPFAMYRPLRNAPAPAYFGLAFD